MTRARQAAAVGGLCAAAYALLFAYELTRNAVESLFVAAHSAEGLPWVWAAGVAGVGGAVALYNRYATRLSLIGLTARSVALSAASLALLVVLRSAGVLGATFLLFVWKEVYIVVLLESLWTIANAVFTIRTARWIYWMFLSAGSAGAITGGLAVGEIAEGWGTVAVLWWVQAIFLVLLGLVGLLGWILRNVLPATRQLGEGSPPLGDAWRVVRQSDYLLWMFFLVGVVQVVITVIDYQYNVHLEAAFPETDEQTSVRGQVQAATNSGALVLQVLSGPILRLLGVPGTLIAIPVLVVGTTIAALVRPGFTSLAWLKGSTKAFDYSIFKAAKEILYIPLDYDEKVRGKALVDMFMYRSAKGGASLLLGALLVGGLAALTVGSLLPLAGLWLAITAVIARRFRRRVSRAEEMS